MKLVVVSQRVDQYSNRKEIRDSLDQKLLAFLIEAGFLPVPVPNVLATKTLGDIYDYQLLKQWLESVNPSAIVLSGGNDLGSCESRDLTEECLLRHAEEMRLPLLGLCRGMQMMSLWSGGTLRAVDRHVRTRHRISGKIEGYVNSYHSSSIESCPEGYEVLAHSEDGEIEAIANRSLPWQGWMWHPERNDQFCYQDLERVRSLFAD